MAVSQSVAQTYELSAPQVVVNGNIIPIVPNSLKVRIPGDWKVRAMSAGGGSTQVVAGLDVTNLLGKMDFKVANTSVNFEWVRALKAAMIDGIGCTVQINDTITGWSASFQNMFFSKEADATFSSASEVPIELEGSYVA